MRTVAQREAGPAASEGRWLYHKGLSPEEALQQSYYAMYASMIAGNWHVMRAYAEEAKAAGELDRWRGALELATDNRRYDAIKTAVRAND